jgi:thioredoxin-related protein
VEKYNSEIAKLDNLELVQVSVDRDAKKAVAWAKKESFPWPTILMTDIEKTLVKDIKTNAVPTYVLIDKDGKEISRAHDSGSVIKKFKEVTK